MTNEGSLPSKHVKRSKRAAILLTGIFTGYGGGGEQIDAKTDLKQFSNWGLME